MSEIERLVVHGTVVEDTVQLTLVELTRACGSPVDAVVALVSEGVLAPSGEGLLQWRFDGVALRRARTALRLAHDLELDAHAVALVLDLLDELEALRAQLQRAGRR
jgi:chaperone modulatory protein CbpM